MPREKPKEPGRRPCVVQGYLTEMCLVKAVQFQKSFQCDIQDAKIFMRGHQVFTASPYNKSFTDIWTQARIVKVSEGQLAPSCRFTEERSKGKRSHLDANEQPRSKNKSSQRGDSRIPSYLGVFQAPMCQIMIMNVTVMTSKHRVETDRQIDG